jgi:hypothetical protein
MTPAQRKYDTELVASLRTMAQNILPRSRKLHDTFKLAADRIENLSMSAPVEAAPQLDLQGNAIQPASTSDPKPKQLEPMRD